MIGESGVGKSTLVGRLCEDRFLPDHRQYTLGMCVACAYACTCICMCARTMKHGIDCMCIIKSVVWGGDRTFCTILASAKEP